MRFANDKKFKAWKDVKEGDIICYYDKGKIHKQIVHSVEEKTDVSTHVYGYTVQTTTQKYILIKAGRGSNIVIRPFMMDYPFLETRYFTRFTSVEAATECLKKYLGYAQKKADKAKQKYERKLATVMRYKKAIEDNYGK